MNLPFSNPCFINSTFSYPPYINQNLCFLNQAFKYSCFNNFFKSILRNLFRNPCFTGKSFCGPVTNTCFKIQSLTDKSSSPNPINALVLQMRGAIVVVVGKPRVKTEDLGIVENYMIKRKIQEQMMILSLLVYARSCARENICA